MSKQTSSSEFVSIFEFERITGISRQKLYRLIREKRINPNDYRLIEKTVQRLQLRRSLKL